MISKPLSLGLLTWLTISPSAQAEPATLKRCALAPSLPQLLSAEAQVFANTPLPPKTDSRMAQSKTAVITDVQINSTLDGITILLVSDQPLSATASQVVRDALIINIPDAALALADEAVAEQFDPAEGIALVQVSSLPDDGVQMVITGTDAIPTAEVVTTAAGLTLRVVTGVAQAGEADPPLRIVVTGEGDEGYNPSNASIGTRTDTPLREIPQAIQVIPREVIEDQQAINITEALRNAPGIVPTNSARTNFTVPIIRGFGGFSGFSDLFRRNGLRDSQGGANTGDTVNIERIEVLRGPASVLYGAGSPGGVINVVTKQPLSEPFYEIGLTAGSYSLYRGTLDLSGPLDDAGNLLYRFNAAAETSESFVDFYNRDRYLINPVLAWQIGENTRLTAEFEYRNFQNPNDFGLPAVGTVLDNPSGDIARDRYIGEPELEDRRNIDSTRGGYRLEHEFNSNWRIQNAFDAVFRQENALSVFGTGLSADGRTLSRRFFDTGDGFDISSYTMDTYAVGNFNTGSIEHELVTGIELFREETFNRDASFGAVTSLDLFDPQYDNAVLEPEGNIDDKETIDGLGLYIQDQIKFSDNLILVLGGRFDIASVRSNDFLTDASDFQQNEAFSPRVGVVYTPVEPISLYASYSRSFQQEVGRAFDNSIFAPQRGTQYEIGLKADINDQLLATLALYDLTRSNLLTEDPDNPGFDIQTGEQNSQGIELNIAGEILPGWNIVAGYAYNDARITQDNTFQEGNRLNNAPENAFSLWTTYQIPDGDLSGLGFGLGFFYVGERQGDLANTFTLSNYLRTDAALFYERDRLRAAVNIRNLFDVDYFETAQNAFRVYPGEPLTVSASLSWQF